MVKSILILNRKTRAAAYSKKSIDDLDIINQYLRFFIGEMNLAEIGRQVLAKLTLREALVNMLKNIQMIQCCCNVIYINCSTTHLH